MSSARDGAPNQAALTSAVDIHGDPAAFKPGRETLRRHMVLVRRSTVAFRHSPRHTSHSSTASIVQLPKYILVHAIYQKKRELGHLQPKIAAGNHDAER